MTINLHIQPGADLAALASETIAPDRGRAESCLTCLYGYTS
jgi:hypothetical protein